MYTDQDHESLPTNRWVMIKAANVYLVSLTTQRTSSRWVGALMQGCNVFPKDSSFSRLEKESCSCPYTSREGDGVLGGGSSFSDHTQSSHKPNWLSFKI